MNSPNPTAKARAISKDFQLDVSIALDSQHRALSNQDTQIIADAALKAAAHAAEDALTGIRSALAIDQEHNRP